MKYYSTILAAAAMAAFVILLASCTTIEPSGKIPEPPVVTSTSVNTSTSTSVSTIPACPAIAPAGCPVKGAYQAIDISEAVTRKLLEAAKCAGIHTVIRYYDWPGQETIKGKIPTVEEMGLILVYGFNVLFVFQHNNGSYSTFQDATRPAKDVAAILSLAEKFGQPKGSGVYIGVDADFGSTAEKETIKKYFAAISPKLREAGFKVGMYGGGANCTNLQAAKLIDLPCWIAASSWGWTGTTDVLAAGNYGLKQKVNQFCMSQSLDYNSINPNHSEVGAWKP